MSRCLYVMEGQIEDRFISDMKRMNIIIAGKTEIFNLMQSRIKPTSGILTMVYDKVFAIIDTDVCSFCEIDNLIYNLKKLQEISRKPICLLVQKNNFEDELCYICNGNDLTKLLNLKNASTKDLKKYLAQKIEYCKMGKIANFSKYCSRGEFLPQKIISLGNTLPKKVKIIDITKCK